MSAPERHLLYLAPLGMGVLLAISAGALFAAGWLGRPATGDRVLIEVTSGCAEQFEPVVSSRIARMGLGDPVVTREGDVVKAEVTLPGRPGDRETVPAALVRPGHLTVHVADSHDAVPDGDPIVTEVDVVETSLSLDLRGHPYVVAVLQPHATERATVASETSALLYEVDGIEAGHMDVDFRMTDSTLELKPSQDMLADEMQLASDWHIALSDPAPCQGTARVVDPTS